MSPSSTFYYALTGLLAPAIPHITILEHSMIILIIVSILYNLCHHRDHLCHNHDDCPCHPHPCNHYYDHYHPPCNN